MNIPFQPTLNACLNLVSAGLLFMGWKAIRAGKQDRHRKLMITALVSSALFLVSYVIYHYQAGSIPYPYHNWTRPVYFIILVPHVILAAVMVPFILLAVYFALKGQFDRHTRVTRKLWPIWMFVSVSGVVVYLMLYIL